MEYAIGILVELEGEERTRWTNKVIAVLLKQKGNFPVAMPSIWHSRLFKLMQIKLS